MFSWFRLSLYLPYIATGIFILGILYGIYHYGYKRGEADLQVLWNQERDAHNAIIDKLEAAYARLEVVHRAENTRITHELAQAEKALDVALAEQRAEFERRLHSSSERAAFYERQASSGAAQCRDLAGHAAELDRTLEEGRGLVSDLRRTLRLRDEQLRQLGRQILNDRALLNAAITDGSNE